MVAGCLFGISIFLITMVVFCVCILLHFSNFYGFFCVNNEYESVGGE